MRRLMTVVMATILAFVLLTLLGMVVYRGGTGQDVNTEHYLFFQNFFSDLGLTVAHNGQQNLPSALLFAVALTGAGLGLIIFFVAVVGLFRGRRVALALAVLGSIFGVVAGLGYVGVAFTPANLVLDAHMVAVLVAFISFFVAVLFYLPAVLLNPLYPNRYALVYLLFALLLGGYIALLLAGPRGGTAAGHVLQVTAQKVIVYAALVTVFVQAWGVRRVVGE